MRSPAQRHRSEAEPLPQESPPAVILAAGAGSRLANRGAALPKPLVSVAGLSLAEHSIAVLQEAGIERFLVVLGHEHERVRAHFDRIAARRRCAIDFEVAPDWSRGNGVSALAARRMVAGGSFVLTMVDHLLDPSMVSAAVSAVPAPGEIVLAVDRDKERIHDLDDLTKVQLAGEQIIAIGKDLANWDAGDTGLFHASPALFDGLEAAQRAGGFALTDGVRVCTEAGRVRAVDVTGADWLDVDTPHAQAEAERRRMARLTKGGEDGFVSQYLNRPISRRLSVLLARTAVTPNQITIGSFFLALLGAGCLALPDASWWLAGGLLVQLASIIDGCDGEVARLKRVATARGAWLDTLLDRYADAALVLAITWSAAHLNGAAWTWPAGLWTAVGFLLTSYLKKEYQLRFGQSYPATVASRLSRRDLRTLVIAAGAVAGYPWPALLGVGILSHLAVLWMLLVGFRRPPSTRKLG